MSRATIKYIILLTLIIPARSEDTSLQMKQLDFNEMSYYQNAASLYKDSGKAEHWSLNDKLQIQNGKGLCSRQGA